MEQELHELAAGGSVLLADWAGNIMREPAPDFKHILHGQIMATSFTFCRAGILHLTSAGAVATQAHAEC